MLNTAKGLCNSLFDVDLTIALKDWLFALDGHRTMYKGSDYTMTKVLVEKRDDKWKKFVQVGVEGLQILKTQAQKRILQDGLPLEGPKEAVDSSGGINLEYSIVISQDDVNLEMVKWMVENFKVSVNQPDELQHLAVLCKS
ncbi:uncharacterized protein LOC131325708 [Rhododendron vialii]|uniref:uncharacterized protein LOC131325708 n=1 Tax=Rhododendron vialii TaxID=182163 RepID=UPI00265EC703|nr:uncharacterized protein LOC131325708 [Rhododendron vialii]